MSNSFSVAAESTHKVAPRLKKILQSNPERPLAECVFVEASGSTLQLTASNDHASLTENIELLEPIESPVRVTVSGDLFVSVLSKVRKGPISFEIGNRLTVKTNTGEFHIGAFDHRDYPYRFQEHPYIAKIDVKREKVFSMFRKVGFCISKEDSLKNVSGALIEVKDQILRLVAAQSHKLAVCWLNVPEHQQEFSVLLSESFCGLVPDLIKEGGQITIKVAEPHVVIEDQSFRLVGRRLVREFVPYERGLIDVNYHIEINKNDFRKAINRAKLFESKVLKAQTFEFQEDKLVIRCENPETSSSGEIEVPCDNPGSPVTLHFDPVDWSTVLRSFKEEELFIGIMGEHLPVRVDENDFTFVLQSTLVGN